MTENSHEPVELSLVGIQDLGYAEDHSFATFRLATVPPSPLVEAGPFELGAAVAKLQELLRFLQQGLLDKGLGAPGSSLIVERYQVDPNLSSDTVTAQLRPRGGDVTLKYQLDPTTLRKFAHELLAAADQVDNRERPKAN